MKHVAVKDLRILTGCRDQIVEVPPFDLRDSPRATPLKFARLQVMVSLEGSLIADVQVFQSQQSAQRFWDVSIQGAKRRAGYDTLSPAEHRKFDQDPFGYPYGWWRAGSRLGGSRGKGITDHSHGVKVSLNHENLAEDISSALKSGRLNKDLEIEPQLEVEFDSPQKAL